MSETPHTLKELRELFAPGEVLLAPSQEELARVEALVPGASVESDRIVLPLFRDSARPFSLGIWATFASSAVALVCIGWLAPHFRAGMLWFILHTAWMVPLLFLARHLTTKRRDLIVFPSSPCCQVLQGQLAVTSFHHGRLFAPLRKTIGISPHLGHLLLRKVRGGPEGMEAVAAILNRYVLIGTKTREPEGLGDTTILPGAFTRWLLDDTECQQVDRDSLVFRVIPTHISEFGALLTGAWFYGLGPIVGALAPHLWPVNHAVLLALAAASVCWWIWEHRPRLATLLAHRRTIVLTEKNGASRNLSFDRNPFYPEGEDACVSLRFRDPALRGRRHEYRIALALRYDAILAEPIALLGEYLGLPAASPPPASLGGR